MASVNFNHRIHAHNSISSRHKYRWVFYFSCLCADILLSCVLYVCLLSVWAAADIRAHLCHKTPLHFCSLLQLLSLDEQNILMKYPHFTVPVVIVALLHVSYPTETWGCLFVLVCEENCRFTFSFSLTIIIVIINNNINLSLLIFNDAEIKEVEINQID